jgi:hypothetical protein
VQYTLPYDWAAQVNDNVLADEQVLDVRGVGLVREMHILYAGDWIDGKRAVLPHYADTNRRWFRRKWWPIQVFL